jgi:hypothetical protein
MMHAGDEERALRARYLQVRAKMRALAATLAAAEARLRREARTSEDPEMAILVAQVNAQRASLEQAGAELELRLQTVNGICVVADRARVSELRARARRGTDRTTSGGGEA